MTEWHLGWQRAVPPERREVVMGPHRADIVTASGGVVEIQHSPISVDVITEREEFYGDRMAWIFDARASGLSSSAAAPPVAGEHAVRLRGLRRVPGSGSGRGQRARAGTRAARATWRRGSGSRAPDVRFRGGTPAASLVACRRPVFLDLGVTAAVLRIRRVRRLPPRDAAGLLYTRASVEGWLTGRRAAGAHVLPSGDRAAVPAMTRRTGSGNGLLDAWRARQDADTPAGCSGRTSRRLGEPGSRGRLGFAPGGEPARQPAFTARAGNDADRYWSQATGGAL